MGIEKWRNLSENRINNLWNNLVKEVNAEIGKDVFLENISFDIYNNSILKRRIRGCSRSEKVEKKFYALYWDKGMPNNKDEFTWFVDNCAVGINKKITSFGDILMEKWILADDYSVIKGKENIFDEIFDYLSDGKEFQNDYQEYKFLFEKINIMDNESRNASMIDSIDEMLYEDEGLWEEDSEKGSEDYLEYEL